MYVYNSSKHQFSSFQSLSCVWLFLTPWIAARQASLSITHSQSSLRLTSIESVDLDYCDIEWFALEMNRDHSIVVEIASSYCILDSSVDHDGYSISSEGFLPAVVDIMVIWVKYTHSSPFCTLIPRMSTFTLAISCLTASNLPWFMDLIFQVPIQYCSL